MFHVPTDMEQKKECLSELVTDVCVCMRTVVQDCSVFVCVCVCVSYDHREDTVLSTCMCVVMVVATMCVVGVRIQV